MLIFTMGKVGSTTLEKALDNSIHTHTLYGNPPCPPYYRMKFNFLHRIARKLITYPLKRLFFAFCPSLKIVTFYREQNDRNLSMFFQDLQYWLSVYTVLKPGIGRIDTDDLLERCYLETFNRDYPDYWIKNELSRFTKIPSYELYLGNKNFKIIKRNRIELFIGRLEYLPEIEANLAYFLGIQNFFNRINVTNSGSKKWYSPIYRELKDRLSFGPHSESTDYNKKNGYE